MSDNETSTACPNLKLNRNSPLPSAGYGKWRTNGYQYMSASHDASYLLGSLSSLLPICTNASTTSYTTPPQVFGFVPCLLIDEKRKDVARFDLGCCWKETTQPGRIISGPPRVRSRRDSFVLEQLSDTDHPASIADETWNDTGDEARSPPCSPAAPFVGKTVPTQPSSSCRYGTSHPMGELSLPFPRSPPRVRNGGSERGAGRNNGQDCLQTKRPDVHQPRSRHEAKNNIITAEAKSEASAGGLRVSALTQEKPLKNMTTACFEAVEASRNPRGWGRGQGGTGGSEPSCWGGVVQGYCNWLLDRNSARRAVLAGFGVLVAIAVSITSVE
ncbi:unnamed protein product, partial [Ectocarpus sp. 12 AP-2014]